MPVSSSPATAARLIVCGRTLLAAPDGPPIVLAGLGRRPCRLRRATDCQTHGDDATTARRSPRPDRDLDRRTARRGPLCGRSSRTRTPSSPGSPTAPSPTTSRRWRRRRPALFGACIVGVNGRASPRSATRRTEFSIQSVSKPFVFASVCDAIGPTWCASGSASTAPAAVQLGDGHRAERRPHDEPDGQRGSHRHDQPRARATPPRRSGSSSQRAVPLRRPAA